MNVEKGVGITARLSRTARLPIGVALALALAAAAAYAGRQATLTAGAVPETDTPVALLEVVFHETPEGTVEVRRGDGGEVLHRLPPGEGGFMRGVLRPLRRERMRAGVSDDTPYRLARWPDGRLTLSDPGAGLVLELAAYGESSVAAFAALLDGRTAPDPGEP